MTLRKLPGRPDPRLAEQPAGSAPPLPPGAAAVFLGVSYFGAKAEVIDGAHTRSCPLSAIPETRRSFARMLLRL